MRNPMDGLPMQPVLLADDGVARFRRNRIVEAFYEAASTGNKLGLNDIAIRAAQGEFTKAEQMQFAMLIGYSVSGFGDLSYAHRSVVDAADALVNELPPAKKRH